MYKKAVVFISLAVLVSAVVVGLHASEPAAAANYINQSCAAGGGGGSICTDAQAGAAGFNVTIGRIINGILTLVGIIAVIMIIIGGIKYTTSNGDQSAITSAKNTILYSVIGLVVAILSFAIVTFVVSTYSKPAGSTTNSTTQPASGGGAGSQSSTGTGGGTAKTTTANVAQTCQSKSNNQIFVEFCTSAFSNPGAACTGTTDQNALAGCQYGKQLAQS